jgi:hypothetical protein
MLQWRATITPFQELLASNASLLQGMDLCVQIPAVYGPGLRSIMKRPEAFTPEDEAILEFDGYSADFTQIRHEIRRRSTTSPNSAPQDELPLSPPASNVVQQAREEANQLKHDYIGTEHLLLGLIHEPHATVDEVLVKPLGLKLDKVRQEILDLLG